MTGSHPHRRLTDQPCLKRMRWAVRDNWYRDVWLLAITLVVIVTVFQSRDTSNRAKDLAVAVQEQRVAAIRTSCEDQNMRHDAAIAFNEQAPKRAGVDPQVAKAVAGLLNLVVPKLDCDQRVRDLTKGKP